LVYERKWSSSKRLNILKNKVTLFNLDVDESEKNDLSKQEAIVKDQLLAAWIKFCAQMPAPCNQAQRNKVAFTQQENSSSKGVSKVPQTIQYKATILEMLEVEGGTFTMGDTWNDGNPDEKPTQTVTISSFRLAKTEVTQKQWTTVMGTNPSKKAGEN
jgi:formylglycine-generating enzyme required for sulfatase activity